MRISASDFRGNESIQTTASSSIESLIASRCSTEQHLPTLPYRVGEAPSTCTNIFSHGPYVWRWWFPNRLRDQLRDVTTRLTYETGSLAVMSVCVCMHVSMVFVYTCMQVYATCEHVHRGCRRTSSALLHNPPPYSFLTTSYTELGIMLAARYPPASTSTCLLFRCIWPTWSFSVDAEDLSSGLQACIGSALNHRGICLAP